MTNEQEKLYKADAIIRLKSLIAAADRLLASLDDAIKDIPGNEGIRAINAVLAYEEARASVAPLLTEIA